MCLYLKEYADLKKNEHKSQPWKHMPRCLISISFYNGIFTLANYVSPPLGGDILFSCCPLSSVIRRRRRPSQKFVRSTPPSLFIGI